MGPVFHGTRQWAQRVQVEQLSLQFCCYNFAKLSRRFILQGTFPYDSDLWTNNETFNTAQRETVFDTQETKLTTYWDTSFTKICLGMMGGGGGGRKYQFSRHKQGG